MCLALSTILDEDPSSLSEITLEDFNETYVALVNPYLLSDEVGSSKNEVAEHSDETQDESETKGVEKEKKRFRFRRKEKKKATA